MTLNIQLPVGKRITTLSEYAGTLLPLDVQDDHSKINLWGCVAEPFKDLLPVQITEKHFRFLPGPEFSPRLYRGENEYHPVCRPSLFRQTNITHRYLLAKKQRELAVVIDQHPAKQDLDEWKINQLSFSSDIEALAQHYGFKTALLDFSRSKDVAMFFATCEIKNPDKPNTYRPKTSGTAVLYTADLNALLKINFEKANFIPLGLEPMPRPDAQKALAVRLTEDENLNEMPWVKKEFFEVTRELSQHYFDMFDGGSTLFPQNDFDNLIEEVRCCKHVDIAKCRLLPEKRFVLQALHTVEEAIREIAWTAWLEQRQQIIERIGMRPMADHFVSD